MSSVNSAIKLVERLLGYESVSVGWIDPLFAAAVSALRARHPDLAQRCVLHTNVVSYAETIGLSDILAGRAKYPQALSLKSYSPLTRLDQAVHVEQCNEVISAFIVAQLQDFGELAHRIANIVGELHDNVVSHAQGQGFSIAQVYKQDTNPLLAFSIADAGRGMLANARKVESTIRDHGTAIEWCLKKGNTSGRHDDLAQFLPDDATSNPFPPSVAVRSDGNHHLGLGLARLLELVQATGGEMHIWSGDARVTFSKRRGLVRSKISEWKGVIVDVRLPVTRLGEDLESDKALGSLAERLGL